MSGRPFEWVWAPRARTGSTSAVFSRRPVDQPTFGSSPAAFSRLLGTAHAAEPSVEPWVEASVSSPGRWATRSFHARLHVGVGHRGRERVLTAALDVVEL